MSKRDPIAVKEYNKKYYITHKDSISAYRRAYKALHKKPKRVGKIDWKDPVAVSGYNKQYRAERRDLLIVQQRAYRLAHLEECRARENSYRDSHKEYRSEHSKEYYKSSIDKRKNKDIICKNCGCKAKAFDSSKGVFCSGKCQSDWSSGANSPGWKGGISFEPYCPKFNNDLKRRIRAFFGDMCITCGKTKDENVRQLSCHHVEYNKSACCDGKPVQFAALCNRCHGISNHETERWENMLHRIIDEIYDGRSYFTKEEWREING